MSDPEEVLESVLQVYTWEPAYQRKVLALASRGEVHRTNPGIFEARFFGAEGKSRVKSPRQRIAELIASWTKSNPSDTLDAITMDQLVSETSVRLKPEERSLFVQEWKAIRDMEVSDPHSIIDRMREWAQEAAIVDAIIRSGQLAAEARSAGKMVDRDEVRKLMDAAYLVGSSDIGRQGYLLRDAEERMAMWQADNAGNHLSTGFEAMDRVLDGGPMVGEVFYALAPPKGCKTAFLLNIALNASRIRKGVVFFSYEMMWQRMLMRMDRNMARATKQELRDDITPLQKAIAGWRMAGAEEVVVHEFDARKQGCLEAQRVVENLRANGHPIDLVVMDYLNIMSAETREREKRHELAQISREMSAFAKELRVRLWSAALIKKEAGNKERIRKEDITESFEVIAVLDGAMAIGGTKEMREQKLRRVFASALREEEDERDAGLYRVDLARMHFEEVSEDAMPRPDPTEESDEKPKRAKKRA